MKLGRMKLGRKRFDQLYRSRDVAGLTRAMQDAPRRRRLAAVAALREVGSPEAEAALIRALSDPSPFVRRVAVEALADIDPYRDPAPIIRALRSEGSTTDELSPNEVIDAGLYRLRALDTVPILMRGLGSDDSTERMMAATVLGDLADPRAAPALAAALSDSGRGVRTAAREALDRTRNAGD